MADKSTLAFIPAFRVIGRAAPVGIGTRFSVPDDVAASRVGSCSGVTSKFRVSTPISSKEIGCFSGSLATA